jgi:hypothetical protein
MSNETQTHEEMANDALQTFYNTEKMEFAVAAVAHAVLAVLAETRKPPLPYVVNASPPSVTVK